MGRLKTGGAMHKGIVILTKAESAQEAQSNVENFLEHYADHVYDWFEIGGRWAGLLNDEQDKENNVMPLPECLEQVRKYKVDPQSFFYEESKRAEDSYGQKSKKPNKHMYAYMMKCAYTVLSEGFCFDCDVFNIFTYDYEIPADPAGFWAVIVDFHS